MLSQNTLNQLSRRKWLRDAAIAATSVTVVPSFFIGCTDHRPEPGSGLVGAGSAPPIIEGELEKAAENIFNMIGWLDNLHDEQDTYMTNMYNKLKTGNIIPSYGEFIVNVVLDILIGAVTAGAIAIETVTAGVAGAGIVAGLAVVSELIKKFTLPEGKSKDLKETYSDFKISVDDSFTAVKDALTILADRTLLGPVRYKNLRDRWTQEIDFNGKKRPISDLAKAAFPSDKDGKAYVDFKDAAMLRFKKHFWNVMFVQASDFHSYRSIQSGGWYDDIRCDSKSPAEYAKTVFYADPENASRYLRGYYFHPLDRYYFNYWYFTFDGKELPASLATELFKDDARGHIINPKGLFDRDYVFTQFHKERQSFGIYHDLRTDEHYSCNDNLDFVHSTDDYVFTGGDFPILTKPK